MALDPFSAAIGKTALAAITKPTLGLLRTQIARRGAEYADLSKLAGADRELDEAIAVLRAETDSLPEAIALRLKGFLSQRPATFEDENARRFIEDDRIVALVKAGARKTFSNLELDEELADARAIHAELFGEEGIFGETLLEDAVRFATLTLLAHLTPADRLVIEFIAERHDEVISELHQISGQLEDLKRGQAHAPSNIDQHILDQAVQGEVRKLRRQRFAHGRDIEARAEALGARLENGLQLASGAAKAAALREIAVVLSRANRPDDAEVWAAKAAALGVSTDFERARIALARGQIDDALRLLRDNDDPIAKSLLIDAVQRRDGEAAALEYFEQHFNATDLTGHALQSMGVRLVNAERLADGETLLARASPKQIDDNPVLLYFRARMHIGGALPPDVADRFVKSDGMIPQPVDLRDDDEGNRQLAAAREDLLALQAALADLDAPDLAALTDVNLLYLNLSVGDEASRERGRKALVARLSNPDEAIELVPIVAAYGIEIDWSPIRTQLEQAEQLGGYDDTQLRAAFALVMQRDSPNEIAQFIQKYRTRLKEFQSDETAVAILIEALSKIGDIEGARALLSNEDSTLSESTVAFLEATIAEAEGADSISVRLAQFDLTGSTHDLQILVAVLARSRDDRLGNYLVQLWRLRHQVEDARRACDALIGAGKEHEAETFLEELGDLTRQDSYLRTHLAWARLRQGALLEAAEELRALTDAGVDNYNTRQLTIMLAVERGRWSELEPFLQKELSAEADRSAPQLLSLARIALAIDSSTTMALVRAAVAKAPDDPRINLDAYSIAVSAGVERGSEANEWFARAIAGSDETGPVQMKEFDDVVSFVKESRAQADQVNELIMTAQVPIFMALRPMQAAQSTWMLRQLPDNAEEIDSRRRAVLPLFAGNRQSLGSSDPKSISFDPLALLVLDYLGLLKRTLAAFDEIVLPAGTLHSFFEDRGKSGPSQPSRIAQAREIKDRTLSGMLTVEALAAPTQQMAETVDEEFARLFAAATARGGYVIDTAPLRPPGRPRDTVDPAPFASRLISPSGLVQSLLSAGTVSSARAKQAATKVAGSGVAWENEPEPSTGRPLFLTNIAVQYLSDAELLPTLKSFAGALVVLPDVGRLADQEIAAGEVSAKVRQGIERIRETLAQAISEGRARVGPTRLRRDEREGDQEEERELRNMGPIVGALRDSAGVDAFVCDDRAMNKYLQFTDQSGREVPFLTTPDVLVILHRRGVISDCELAAAREKLRLAGVGLMPVDHEELVRVVKESNWAAGPNAELRAIRDSIHLPLARKVIQLPEERHWFKAVSINLGFAIRRVWQEMEDVTLAERAATYLMDVIPDPSAWSASDESPDRALWVQDVSRHTLWAYASIFDLPKDRARTYRQWFDTKVAPGAERRDPGAMDAMARTLFGFLNTPIPDEVSDGGE